MHENDGELLGKFQKQQRAINRVHSSGKNGASSFLSLMSLRFCDILPPDPTPPKSGGANAHLTVVC